MKSMLILSQCMEFKSTLSEFGFELKVLICIASTVLALSLFKLVYYHLLNTHQVKKLKHLLEARRPFHVNSNPVSPLPKIERVPRLSVRRRSGQTSSNDSLLKEQGVQPDSPVSRCSTNTSTAERTETHTRRRKNQIVAAEILL